MKKKRLIVVAGFTLALTIIFLSGCAQPVTLGGLIQGQQEGVWVNGVGKVTVVPDIASVSLGIASQESSVAAAQSKATETMNRLMGTLNDHGIAEKDIQTQQFSISQVTRWDNEKNQEIVIGYRVSNIVVAKIRTLDKVGAIIDAVAVAGGDLTRINGISFSVDDPTVYHQEAREKAMAQAEVSAKQLASLGGVALGKPTYISESTYTPPPIIRVSAEAPAAPMPAPTPISPGEMEVSVNVQVVYAIEK